MLHRELPTALNLDLLMSVTVKYVTTNPPAMEIPDLDTQNLLIFGHLDVSQSSS